MLKANLMLPSSATIDYLLQICDKVAFFYCGQDEENRRDRQEILLCLIKQLAYPIDGSAIHPTALQAYKNSQTKARGANSIHYSAEASITLLLELLECYERPALVVDALDECLTRDSRDFTLTDLLSVLHRSKGPVKLFISSRPALDIENILHALPHRCIETQRNNDKDMENYIKDELSLQTQDKRLLNRKVPAELGQYIQETLIKEANGM